MSSLKLAYIYLYSVVLSSLLYPRFGRVSINFLGIELIRFFFLHDRFLLIILHIAEQETHTVTDTVHMVTIRYAFTNADMYMVKTVTPALCILQLRLFSNGLRNFNITSKPYR